MTALSLANMLTRVKRIVPSTVIDTPLQDHILERMNYLVSLDTFPFQEKYQTATLAAAGYRMATPDNFATVRSLTLWMGDEDETEIEILDNVTFSQMFPKPDENTANPPRFATIKVAEGEIWFDCPADVAYTIRLLFYAIPDDATDTTVSQMVELAKLALIHWAAADGYRGDLHMTDLAEIEEGQGNRHLAALQQRYQFALEKDARFISQKEKFTRSRYE